MKIQAFPSTSSMSVSFKTAPHYGKDTCVHTCTHTTICRGGGGYFSHIMKSQKEGSPELTVVPNVISHLSSFNPSMQPSLAHTSCLMGRRRLPHLQHQVQTPNRKNKVKAPVESSSLIRSFPGSPTHLIDSNCVIWQVRWGNVFFTEYTAASNEIRIV